MCHDKGVSSALPNGKARRMPHDNDEEASLSIQDCAAAHDDFSSSRSTDCRPLAGNHRHINLSWSKR